MSTQGYRINVAKKSDVRDDDYHEHYFAAYTGHSGHIARKVFRELCEKFPAPEHSVTISYWSREGRDVTEEFTNI